MALLDKEQVRVLYFSDEGDTVLDEQVWLGSAYEVEVPVNEVIRRAISLGSPALIFAHNHPSGDPQPSTQDVHLTQKLFSICKALQIKVHDHVIVSRHGSFSFRELGYM